jgi:hypothetical protein
MNFEKSPAKVGKLILFMLPLLLMFLHIPLQANEVAAVWTRLYERSTTLDQKLQIMQSIVDQNSRDMIPVLSDALEEQILSLENRTGTTERTKAINLITMIVKELGSLRAAEASSFIWQVVEAVENPVLKGEAIIALGRIGARQYASRMSTMLRNINFNYGELSSQRDNEIIAYALVVALERLKAEESYEPLFFASTGWYSTRSGIKELAKDALSTVVEDPADQLISIMEASDRYGIKESALSAGMASQAAETSKARIAAFAFSEGLRYTPKDGIERRELKSLRLAALRALKELEHKDAAVLDTMGRMLIAYQTERLYDEDEILALIDTMSGYKSDESARILADFLRYQTERRQFGPSDSLRIARATINALGEIGSMSGLEALAEVAVSSFWEGSIQREARSARERLSR